MKRHKLKGAFAIETLISVTGFMFAILAIMMISVIIKTEAKMQYALDQTAKEISSYNYMLSRYGIDLSPNSDSRAAAKDFNNQVGAVFSFLQGADQLGSDWKDLSTLNVEDIENFKKSYSDLKSAFSSNTYDMKQLKTIFSAFTGKGANKAISYLVTPALCNWLMPKYIVSDTKKVDEYLKSVGIEQGMEGIKFEYSNILSDGDSIQLTAIYEINIKSLTFGMLDKNLKICQTACTKAWKY